LELSNAIGFDVETLNYTLGLFLCYPLAMIMNMLPYGQIRHLFSFLLGAFLLQFTLGVQWVHQLITSLIAYGFFLILPRKTNVMIVPLFIMLYMVCGHLHRQYVNYLGYDLDFTGAQMVLTQKLYMLTYNLYDGEQLAKGKDDRAAKKCAEYSLQKIPNLIEFLGYTFCFSNVLSGPASEFTYYCKTCDGSLLYNKDGTLKGKAIPSNVWPSLCPFLISLLNLMIFVVGGSYFHLLDPVDPKGNTPTILTAEFLSKSWLYRYGYMWLGLLIVRQKYYFAWKNSEGANNVWYAGFEGYNDKTGEPIGWDNSRNMDILKFETAQNVQTLSKEWNKKTSNWLTRYVYIRTGGSLAAVYSMSAFWHGFYPGYYLFFLSVPLLTFCERIGRKKISPYFINSSYAAMYGIVCMIVTSIFVEYMVAPFPLLALEWSWNNWKSHYFFGHIGCLLFYIIVSSLPTPKNGSTNTKPKAE
jgi:MBOAT, membrane-bound O-acyltransferase family